MLIVSMFVFAAFVYSMSSINGHTLSQYRSLSITLSVDTAMRQGQSRQHHVIIG